MKNFKRYEKAAWISIIVGIVILIITGILFLTKTTNLKLSYKLNTEIFDHFGSFIGGLLGSFFSFAGTLLLILSLRNQREESEKQQIEARFFEMLKLHRDNVSDITVGYSDTIQTGKSALLWMKRELVICYEIADQIADQIAADFEEIQNNQDSIMNFAYLAFTFGCVENDSIKPILFRKAVKKYPPQYIDAYIKYCNEHRIEITKKKNFPYPLFPGHQTRTDHYFRHLSQFIQYIDNQKSSLLSYAEKYDYMRILRAQLSPHEQALIFFGALSDLGKHWELAHKDPNKRLITKYNLIKNIPFGTMSDGIDVTKYFPDINYQGGDKTQTRLDLEKRYS